MEIIIANGAFGRWQACGLNATVLNVKRPDGLLLPTRYVFPA